MTDIYNDMQNIGKKAKEAAKAVAQSSTEQRNNALLMAAQSLKDHMASIISENAKDLTYGQEKGLSDAMMDRLMLDEERIIAMAEGLEAIAALKDPVGDIMDEWE
ncbi:MAG: gamma-glutamyl-phosphate reductase, partial [Alphaproteobacteria bacterium]